MSNDAMIGEDFEEFDDALAQGVQASVSYLPVGDFICTIDEIKKTKTMKEKKPILAITLTCQQGPPECVGKKYNTTLQLQGMYASKNALLFVMALMGCDMNNQSQIDKLLIELKKNKTITNKSGQQVEMSAFTYILNCAYSDRQPNKGNKLGVQVRKYTKSFPDPNNPSQKIPGDPNNPKHQANATSFYGVT